MEEKRKNKRLDLDVNVQLERLDEDGVTTLKFVHVDVTDISKSGIGFDCKKKLEINSYYDAKIQIWTKEVVDAVHPDCPQRRKAGRISLWRCVYRNDGYRCIKD